MKKRLPFILLGLIAIGAGLFLYTRAEKNDQLSFTGFVEGEEKVIKSEISDRVETVAFTDGSHLTPCLVCLFPVRSASWKTSPSSRPKILK